MVCARQLERSGARSRKGVRKPPWKECKPPWEEQTITRHATMEICEKLQLSTALLAPTLRCIPGTEFIVQAAAIMSDGPLLTTEFGDRCVRV